MKLILITIGIATALPFAFHWSGYRRSARIIARTTLAFFIAPPLLVLSVMSFHAVMRALGPPCFMPTNYHIDHIRALMVDTDMGTGEAVDKNFEHLKQCKPDKRHLAEQLLSDNNGTIVALGMNVIVEESFDDGNVLLMRHLGDTRWNYYLASNDEYARFMQILWKMKREIPITLAERKATEGWSEEYFKKVGLL